MDLLEWLMSYFGKGGTTAPTTPPPDLLTDEEKQQPWLVPQGGPNPSATPPPSLISGGEPVSPDEQALLDALALKRRNQRVVGDIRSAGLTREPVPR